MRRALTILSASLLALTSSYPWDDGYVIFDTRVPGTVDAPVFWFSSGAAGTPLLRTTLYGSNVWASLNLVKDPSGWPPVLPLVPFARFHTPKIADPAAAAYVNLDPSNNRVFVPGAEPGTSVTLIMRAWEGWYYDQADLLGESEPFTVTVGGTNSLGQVFPDPYLVGLQGFAIRPLMEPCYERYGPHFFGVESNKLRFDFVFGDARCPTSSPTNYYNIWASTDLRKWEIYTFGHSTQNVATVYLPIPTNKVIFFL